AAASGLRPDTDEPARSRIDCTMQAGGLVYGVNAYGGRRELGKISEKTLGKKTAKDLQTSDLGAPKIYRGQVCLGARDSAVARQLWPELAGRMTEAGLWGAYELQRKAGPAVVDMKLRGVGFDLEEHRRQADDWSADLNTAQAAYVALTGRHPPENAEQLRDWL